MPCPHCGVTVEIASEYQGMDVACSECQKEFRALLPTQKMKGVLPPSFSPASAAGTGKAIRSANYSAGLAIQFIGFLFLFAFPFEIGIVVTVVCLIVGGLMARGWRCSECRNKIDNKEVRLCPTCRAALLTK